MPTRARRVPRSTRPSTGWRTILRRAHETAFFAGRCTVCRFGNACGAVRWGALRDCGAADEAVAELDLAARAGGACLVGPSGAASSAGLGPVRAAHFVD